MVRPPRERPGHSSSRWPASAWPKADPAAWEELGDAELADRCSRIARRDVTELIARYRRKRPRDPARRIAVAVTTDALYRFPAIDLAAARGTAAAAPTYAYVFAGGTGSHGEDVLFFFDNLQHAALVSLHPANSVLAQAASTAWISFCHTGEPEVPGVGPWPACTGAGRETLLFGHPPRVAADPFAARRPPSGLGREQDTGSDPGCVSGSSG
ncbi:carboxylesterase family protein [Streptomyces roseoverticillatus]|uniref:Carboxylesterase family protein n=1 Tax=Streptomyces roseoverticillatus TaxID=66429 RepID=A0ABV3IWJ5_9ACTN